MMKLRPSYPLTQPYEKQLMTKNSDIKENHILAYDPALLPLLLIDRTRSKEGETHNILWATDNYTQNGTGYGEWDEISEGSVTGNNGLVLRPRVDKSREEQERRSWEKAEVFTPAWIWEQKIMLLSVSMVI